MIGRARRAAALGLLAAFALPACRTLPETDPRYRPAESVLEVIAVLRRHVPDDTYRFEAARDFTGRNVYRSSLLRLESLEHIHAEALRLGHMDGVIAFSKGRALERLRAYELAADAYRIAAELDKELAVEAGRSADVCEGIAAAVGLGIDLDDLAEPAPIPTDVDAVLADYDQRAQRLDELARQAEGSHHGFIVQEEIERTDIARAAYLTALRQGLADGDVRTAAALQQLIVRHKDSKLANRHILTLAGFYEELAEEYVDAYPPESLDFDPARFQELIEAASRLYEIVAGQDGKPEKLEASRRLEAFIAFALRIDRDRFVR